MSAPTKPWERHSFVSNRKGILDQSIHRTHTQNKLLHSQKFFEGEQQGLEACGDGKMDHQNGRNPPPIPARVQAPRSFGEQNTTGSLIPRYGGFGNQYSPYGGYSLGNYGTFGNIGPYPSYGRYDTSSSLRTGSALIRRAEETSRPAFDSIQSIVQAFGSITMMLESTFFAVHNSYCAVLGVAEQFHNLKLNLLNTVGAFTLWRFLKYLYRKILILLRLKKQNIQDDVWNIASSDVSSREARKGAKSWPVLLFFAVVFGTPWLIWKFLKIVTGSLQENEDSWMAGEGEFYIGELEYDFAARSEDELDCQAGNLLRIAPKEKQPDVRGWLLATTDGKTAGLVPANYVKNITRQYGKPELQGTTELKDSNTSLETLYEETAASSGTQ